MMLIGGNNWMFGFVADECVLKAPSYLQDAKFVHQRVKFTHEGRSSLAP